MPIPDDTLVIRHLPDTEPPQFQVQRLSDGQTSPPAAVPSPVGFPVAGRPDSHLLRELQWYLETFLDYPFPPETGHAERVQKALRAWGEQAFTALFGSREAGRLFDAATEYDYARLHLQIASDEAAVLAWPWEALYDPDADWLAPPARSSDGSTNCATRPSCRRTGSTAWWSAPGRSRAMVRKRTSPGRW
jgi:hypothetical protein